MPEIVDELREGERIRLESEKMDTIAVMNICKETVFVEYGIEYYEFAPGVVENVPRYIAKYFLDRCIDQYTREVNDAKFEEFRKRYTGNPGMLYTDFERVEKRCHDPAWRKSLFKKAWLGLVKKFGTNKINTYQHKYQKPENEEEWEKEVGEFKQPPVAETPKITKKSVPKVQQPARNKPSAAKAPDYPEDEKETEEKETDPASVLE